MMEDYLRSEIKRYMKHGKATALFENDSYEAIENFRILQTDYRRQRVMARDIEKRLRKTKGDDERKELFKYLERTKELLFDLEKSFNEMGFTPETSMQEFRRKISLQRNQPLMERITKWGDIEDFLDDLDKFGTFEIQDID